MKTIAPHLAKGLPLAALLLACGGGAPPPQQPRSAASAEAYAPAQEASTLATANEDSEAQPSDLLSWQTEFDQQHETLSSLDCPSACRALRSLERSAEQICVLVGERDLRCADAARRKLSATEQVSERCGPCP